MNNNIKTLTAQLDVFKKYLFGRRTETGMTDAGTNQYSFKVNALNELEVTIDESTDHNEPKIEKIVPKAYTRKKPKGKRASDLSDIEKVRIDDELSEEELIKIFPDGKWTAFESYTYSRLHYIPTSFKVYEHHVMAYKGTGNKIVKAPQKEPGLLRKFVHEVVPKGAALTLSRYRLFTTYAASDNYVITCSGGKPEHFRELHLGTEKAIR